MNGAPDSAALARLFAHGGDLASAALAFPDAPTPWIDLSTGINPIAYPVPPLDADAWTRLPSPADLARLEAVAAARYGARAEETVAAAGAQALISLIPKVFSGRRVAVLAPSYAEHERAWRAAGADVRLVDGLAGLDDADVVVVVNPNNPDGRHTPSPALRALAAGLDRRGGLMVVDEAFMDFQRDSLAPNIPRSALVLRSFGKTYGLAGLRLGFAVAPAPRAAALRAALGPWPVSGPAIAIGALALADEAWLAAAQARLAEDAAWLDDALRHAGFDLVGGCELFRLARHIHAPRRFRALCEAGVLARPFARRPDWLRFGLPLAAQRPRVARALEQLQDI